VRYSLPVNQTHIRPLDIKRDLRPTADLIEACFSSTLDPDGRDYLRHIRRAAADSGLIHWISGRGERASSPLFGYVWEQDQRLVGNLSLIPIYKGGRWMYMIANVAVHPDYRRRGIARELTLKALAHIREHNVSSAWLQVRDDNLAAYSLYASIGFIEQSRRSTWLALPAASTPSAVKAATATPPQAPPDVAITSRRGEDWPLQQRWLNETYPLEAIWNMSYEPQRFKPGWLRQLGLWLNGDVQSHWAARRGEETIGFTSWEPVRGYSDLLWVASSPEHEDLTIRSLLPRALYALQPLHRPLSVNYPFPRGAQAFQDCGFTLQNTLVWMEFRCK
jgi:ribosomal protein S18 acetylase RimI-like enzyme